MEGEHLFVDFKKYCETCEHKDVEETKDPCNECLENPMNLFSHKPVKWEEKKHKKKEKKTNVENREVRNDVP